MPSAVFVPAQLNDLAVDVQLTSVAEGDLLYRGASKWNNLAKPSATGSLLRGGTTPAWATNALLDGNGQLQLSATGSSGGLLLGGDVQIYRSAANVAYIPDSLEVKPNGSTPTIRFRAGADPTKTVAISTDSASYGWELSPTGATSDTLLQILGQSFGGAQGGEFGVYIGDAGYFKVALWNQTDLFRVTRAGQVTIPTQGSTGGIVLGGDANLYRSAANILKTDDLLVAGGGLGVTNSASATTPGSVVKKIEVFDGSGSSLGFLAVYSSIT
jgi:hypothetical protein